MQTDRIQKQSLTISIGEAPRRSLSYNDLKKKRLLRSQKSKGKLKAEGHTDIIVRTQKKKISDHFSIGVKSNQNTPFDERKIKKSVSELNEVFVQMKERQKSKKYIFSKPFYTDRNSNNKKSIILQNSNFNGNQKKNTFFSSIETAGNEKQLIKQIISKKKSQRRLLKFDQIRAQLKRSKSKSKSKSKNKINELQTAPNYKANNSITLSNNQPSTQRNNIRVKKFQTVKETNKIQESHIKKDQIKNKYLTSDHLNKNSENYENLQLKLKSNYHSRRKLKIEDFRTERKTEKEDKCQSNQPLVKVKFHRRLRKTNSQITIKTKSMLMGKSYIANQYNSNKSTISIKPSHQVLSTQNQTNMKDKKLISNKFVDKQINMKQIKQMKKQVYSGNKQKQSIKKVQKQEQEIFKHLQLSAINISQIQVNKQQSISLDMDNEINFVQVIQEQQFQIYMKKTQIQCQEHNISHQKKNTKKQNISNKKSFIQNAQNLENLSNILDFVALPTKQLKIKINRSSKINKKKSQLEKFKKIFPVNFFNQ